MQRINSHYRLLSPNDPRNRARQVLVTSNPPPVMRTDIHRSRYGNLHPDDAADPDRIFAKQKDDKEDIPSISREEAEKGLAAMRAKLAAEKQSSISVGGDQKPQPPPKEMDRLKDLLIQRKIPIPEDARRRLKATTSEGDGDANHREERDDWRSRFFNQGQAHTEVLNRHRQEAERAKQVYEASKKEKDEEIGRLKHDIHEHGLIFNRTKSVLEEVQEKLKKLNKVEEQYADAKRKLAEAEQKLLHHELFSLYKHITPDDITNFLNLDMEKKHEIELVRKIDGIIKENIHSATADNKLWSDLKVMKPLLSQMREMKRRIKGNTTQRKKNTGLAYRTGMFLDQSYEERQYDQIYQRICNGSLKESYKSLEKILEPIIGNIMKD